MVFVSYCRAWLAGQWPRLILELVKRRDAALPNAPSGDLSQCAQRASKLLRLGSLKRSARALVVGGGDIGDDFQSRMGEKLTALNPLPGSEVHYNDGVSQTRCMLTGASPEQLAHCEPPQFSLAACKKRSRGVDLGVATGLGGMPMSSIREWFAEDDVVSADATELVNNLAGARVLADIKEVLCAGRACAVPNRDSSPIRLGIGD